MRLTRFIIGQLVLFLVLTVLALTALGVYYLRLPTLVGFEQYKVTVDLEASGGLYATSNVTFRGITIGKVTDVKPTETGAQATLSITDDYRIPLDAQANVHSVSAIGEQYIDLTSEGGATDYFPTDGTALITNSSVPREIGPALDTANQALAVLPKDKIALLLDETSSAVGGLGPALQRLVDSTQLVVGDFRANLGDIDDIIVQSEPLINSQVDSGDAIGTWAANLNTIFSQTAANDATLRNVLNQAAPTAEELSALLGDVRDSLPQVLANLSIVLDMLKRYNNGVEQTLVVLPQAASIAQTVGGTIENNALLDFNFALNHPPPCLTGFMPASEWRSPADTTTAPLSDDIMYCRIPQDAQNVVRGARNYPCADVPGKRAATPMECRGEGPYVPLGTNPWYGDPNQILNCPAPAARCDQPVEPGNVIPAPTINNGLNPLPGNMVPAPPGPVSDPLTPPNQGGTVQCNGQQPNPCVYTPAAQTSGSAVYTPASAEVVGPDGVRYTVENSTNTGDEGWMEMLAPAS
ncbi:MAG: MCE family protein [Mycobacterium sp.]